jgi:hypothetical protein
MGPWASRPPNLKSRVPARESGGPGRCQEGSEWHGATEQGTEPPMGTGDGDDPRDLPGKSGMGMPVGVDPRSPANRGWGWGWGSGVPCPATEPGQKNFKEGRRVIGHYYAVTVPSLPLSGTGSPGGAELEGHWQSCHSGRSLRLLSSSISHWHRDVAREKEPEKADSEAEAPSVTPGTLGAPAGTREAHKSTAKKRLLA